MCATISYQAFATDTISKHRKVPIESWIREGIEFKFVGDNVGKKKGVRDIREDNHGELKHMYSMIVVQSHVTSTSVESSPHYNRESLPSIAVLPDVRCIQKNLVVLVSRILCRYIKCLSSFSSAVLAHIPHAHSNVMSHKSETVVLDVLAKNEAKHSDTLDIMKTQQGYLGEAFPACHKGGDQLTCERQVCARRHMMDGNTPHDWLTVLEPVTEDWHCLMCFLCVSPA